MMMMMISMKSSRYSTDKSVTMKLRGTTISLVLPPSTTLRFCKIHDQDQTRNKQKIYSCIVPMGFLPWEIRVAYPGESQLRLSRAIHPTLHAGCFSVSIIHRTLAWTTGSLTCAHTLMHAIGHGDVRTHLRESALKVDSGRKIPCRTGESNLRRRCDGPMLYQ